MTAKTTLVGSLVVQAVIVIVGLLVAFGVPLDAAQISAIITAAGFLGLLLALVLWASTVPRSEVVERLLGDEVIAGEANDLIPSGQAVRSLPEHAAAD